MTVVLQVNEYIIEGVHGSSWIRSQKAESFEGIPIRSELSNKYLILYPFLDLLYTECLTVSCNSRVSSEISWTQHVASFPSSPAPYPRRRHRLRVSLYPTQSHLLRLSKFRGFGEFETGVQWWKLGASVKKHCRGGCLAGSVSVLVAFRGIPIWSCLLLPWIPGAILLSPWSLGSFLGLFLPSFR
jgi:hypothetical protein